MIFCYSNNFFFLRVSCTCIMLSLFLTGSFQMASLHYCIAVLSWTQVPMSWLLQNLLQLINLQQRLPIQPEHPVAPLLITLDTTHLWDSILMASVSCISTLNVFILPCWSPPPLTQYFRSLSVQCSKLSWVCWSLILLITSSSLSHYVLWHIFTILNWPLFLLCNYYIGLSCYSTGY